MHVVDTDVLILICIEDMVVLVVTSIALPIDFTAPNHAGMHWCIVFMDIYSFFGALLGSVNLPKASSTAFIGDLDTPLLEISQNFISQSGLDHAPSQT